MLRIVCRWSLVVGLVTLAYGWGAPVARGADVPEWFKPGNEEKYVFVGKDVWDVDSGQKAGAATKVWLGPEVRRIVGADDRVYAPGSEKPAAGLSGRGFVQPLDYSQLPPVTLDNKPYTDGWNNPSFWIAADHRRVVFIQNGDYWRGEIDWPHAKIVNRKQVTSVGQFGPANFPLLWWGNTLLVYGNFDKSKPIVKIDLVGGNVDEMPTYDALNVNGQNRGFMGQVSPNHARIARYTESVIYAYDVRTGKASSFENKLEQTGITLNVDAFGTSPLQWSDDETAAELLPNLMLLKYDFRNSRMDVLFKPTDPPGIHSINRRVQSILPGGRYADICITGGGEQGGAMGFLERYLLDLTTGQKIALPFDDKNSGVWLDDSKYFYYRDKGGLSAVGLWLYNRADNSNKRLGGGQVDFMRMVYLPKRNMIIGVSQQNGAMLRKINLDGSGIADWGACELAAVTRMPEESIDLGYTAQQVDLWKPVAVDAAALAPTEPPQAATGKVKLDQMTKDLPEEQQQFANHAYDYAKMNSELNSFYDPVKFAMIALEAHKAQPKKSLSELLLNLDYSSAADPEHIRRWAQGQATGLLVSDSKFTPEQKEQIATKTAQSMFDAYSAKPAPSVKEAQTLLAKHLTEAKASVGGGQAQQPPQPQQTSSQNQPTQQQQPANPSNNSAADAQKKVDEGVNEAEKAKDTVNKLKGLFGQ